MRKTKPRLNVSIKVVKSIQITNCRYTLFSINARMNSLKISKLICLLFDSIIVLNVCFDRWGRGESCGLRRQLLNNLSENPSESCLWGLTSIFENFLPVYGYQLDSLRTVLSRQLNKFLQFWKVCQNLWV